MANTLWQRVSRPNIAGVVVSAIDRLIRPGQLGDLQIFDFFQRSKSCRDVLHLGIHVEW